MILLLGLWTFVRAMTLGSAAIALENVALRHQLAVLQRSVRRPQFHRWDRAFWVGLSRWWRNWRASLVIVQPATVISWHRRGFELYWRWKSRPRAGRPPIDRHLREGADNVFYAVAGTAAPFRSSPQHGPRRNY